ncbi:MAG: hypothetical protein JOZ67_01235 [Gammaproteobacteria bacterium]|nr:hypothetical protein [Gammaproteobacteria bacterium]
MGRPLQPLVRRWALALVLLLLGAGAHAAAPNRTQFDHLTTGFELIGQHRDLPCESCHANAIFKGTPKDCASCHGVGTAIRATAKPQSHILSTDRCDACHTPIAFRPAVNFDHSQARGSCSTCHNGVQAQGKPPTHIPTDLECDACHTTLSWGGAMFSHIGVTGNCASCHNGVNATGKPANHFPTGPPDVPCEGCHSPTNFVTWAGTTINHAAAAALSCASCHETANYLGMHPSTASAAADSRPMLFDPKHPATGDCGGCHDTVSFAAAAIKPPNHIPTSAPCVQCHTTPGNNKVYSVAGVHVGVTGCLACHGPAVANTFVNVTIVTTPGNHIPIGGLDCNGSGCHSAANVNPGGFKLGAASLTAPTLGAAGHTTVAGVASCQTCHENAQYLGMLVGTGSAAGDSRPLGTLDATHPKTGDCGGCHSTAPTFGTNMSSGSKPANHIPTSAPCTQCHTVANNYAQYSITGTHQGVTGCLACHGPTAGPFANITIVTSPGNHIPIGGLDCNGSGCHTMSKLAAGGFNIGGATINPPSLTAAGHTTVLTAVPACQTCHETAPYLGMAPSTGTTAGDSRPSAQLDAAHPTTGDCSQCHVTTPVFKTNVVSGTKPANHIPTTAACPQCHLTPGNFASYSVTGTHQGVSGCLSCHAPAVAKTFANITIVSTPANHMPIGGLDCNGSGCHTTQNVNAGGFKLGNPNISAPTLTVAGHTTVAAAVSGCVTCHETAPYVGMVASGATAGDSRPSAALDKAHPASGECSGCHTTTPTFASDQTGTAKPANHIPTSAPCAQCHTTPGNNALYSVTGVHQGVTTCLSCHAPAVAGSFANIKIVSTPGNHIPIGSLDCNGSGCHSTANVNPGGFRIGAANVNTPTLTVAGHATVAKAVAGCQTCHEGAAFVGMVASTSSTAGDSRPMALDPAHPASGDCNGCHTTTPTFTSNESGGSKPANHIPTTAACTRCHATAGNYAAYVMGATGHTGITSNCAQCHAYGRSFYNMAPPTLKEPPSGATGHIPAVPPNGTASVACELCHSPTVFTSFSGTVMRHAYVTALACMSCHEYGMQWKTNGGLWTRPSPNHHAGQDCGGSGCHSSRDKRAVRPVAATATPTPSAGARLAPQRGAPPARAPVGGTLSVAAGPHPALTGTCVSCHDGQHATGKPPGHLASSDSCGACHGLSAWLPVLTVDHAQVRGACSSCHNGSAARGMGPHHLPTTAGCDTCHTTNAWTPARFDHAAVTPHTCTSCHNAVRAIGLPRTHIPTTQQCDACHGTLAWVPVRFDHSMASGACASCHNNAAAVGTPSGHLVTRRDCATCHSYPDWSAVHFRHASAAYPGDHRTALACSACHTGGTEQVSYPTPAGAGSCGGCHAKDFRPAAHPKTKGQSYTALELTNCSGACHVYGTTTPPAVLKNQPGPYHRVTDATFKR